MTYQYYPTGVHTAAKMWNKFKRRVKHICDPSAGKGHLIQHAKNGFKGLPDDQVPWLEVVPDSVLEYGWNQQYRMRDLARSKFSDPQEISVVEIDIQHHASLKELGAVVLGYDFLEIKSLATVGSVIMNPPFAEGAKHVLHAWDVVYDAEIVAIINAQSIKNPHTAERQRLVKLIEKHGSVEFLQDQFVDEVERKTEVEIALIYLEKIPGRYLDMDALLGDLRTGDNLMQDIDPKVCNALALPSNFIQDTYHRFVEAVQAARKASEAMAVADRLTDGLGITLAQMQAEGVGNDFRVTAGSIRESANADFKRRYDDLKKRAWGQIIRSSLLTDRVSNQARKKLEASVNNIYALEFSVSNVHGFMAGVIQSMGDIYQDMVCDLFDTIIERSSDNVVFYKSWKSNQKHRLGVRIRKTRFIIPRFSLSSHSGSLEYESERFLADIDKVFGYLHGVRDSYNGLVNAFRNHPKPSSGERMQSEFFDCRYYAGTGTIHFYPKSEAVVDKINLFVGRMRNWLPGDMEEANDDFKKQFEKGESLTKEYMEHYKKSRRNTYGRDNPSYALLQECKGREVDPLGLDRMMEAIDTVHAAKGMHIGPAISHNPKVSAIGCDVAKKQNSWSAKPEQLLLLAG